MLATAERGCARPVPAINPAVLIPQDRIARKPVGPWAQRLTEQLSLSRGTVRGIHRLAGEMGFVGNNAGLIAASRGDTSTAWTLTERQLWWHGRQARRSGDVAVNAHGVQPWVNLGRLESLAGRWSDALSRLSGLASFETAGHLEMGDVRLSGEAWSALVRSRDHFVRFLEVVYISDCVKAMLLNRKFELIPSFVARSGHAGGARWVCEEACVVAECRMGDHGAALSRARAAAREASGWERAVLRLRTAEAYACAGEAERAASILGHMAGLFRQLLPEHYTKPRLMPLTARLATACHEVGLDEDAYAVARRVLEGARAANDEMIGIEMLRVLAATAPEEERESWADACRTAEETTEYARYRRGGPPPPNPVVTELYERLEEVYAN